MAWKLRTKPARAPGTFPAVLISVGEYEKPVWLDSENKFSETEKELKIRWVYKIEGEKGEFEDFKDCTPTNSAKGSLVAWCKASDPKNWNEGVRVSNEKIEAFAKALVGKQFLVTYAENEFGKVVMSSIIPAPSLVKKISAHQETPPPPTDDDIPF